MVRRRSFNRLLLLYVQNGVTQTNDVFSVSDDDKLLAICFLYNVSTDTMHVSFLFCLKILIDQLPYNTSISVQLCLNHGKYLCSPESEVGIG